MKNKIGNNIEIIMMGIVLAVGVLGVFMAQVGHAKTTSGTKGLPMARPMQSASCTPTPSPSPSE